jgi:hypothetical protein
VNFTGAYAKRSFSHREKVSPKATDEGMRVLTLLANAATPHPSASQTPSPYGRGLARARLGLRSAA